MGPVHNPNSSQSEIIHASCVRVAAKAVLIRGASGTGKSSLALQLTAFGGELVADDRTILSVSNNVLFAACPDPIDGKIEARGVGILRLPSAGQTPVALLVDMNKAEDARLPYRHTEMLLGVTLPCLWNAPSPHFAAAVLQYLRHGIDHKI
ncbi:serine kinase [Sulfitobacter sp. F26204]|uniref:HPr kinase/phosphorylase n=1 Tax=Sulfitobacter sp. F26204 TaxID=2996014 RepID=UPI00225E2E91|nr:serine kinase [Sulfitobacter sp. F26204]MCX7558667.1 serine kinase [Sulfitobacter sp. F26204]